MLRARLLRTAVLLILANGYLLPMVFAQGGGSGGGQPASRSRRGGTPVPRAESWDKVLAITGKVETHDGSPVPHDAIVERVCNGNVRQRANIRKNGVFVFELDTGTSLSELDASSGLGTLGRENPQVSYGRGTDSQGGMDRRDLVGCELRVKVTGYRSSTVDLLRRFEEIGGYINVGTLFVQAGGTPPGTAISATTLKAPKDARKAYEKGLQAARTGKMAEAQEQLQKAVQVFPGHAAAWVELGALLEQQNQVDAARNAYAQAITADPNFVPPYLRLALMDSRAGRWPEVLANSKRALELDPLTYPVAHFCQAVANFYLNDMAGAEASARQAERLDTQHQIPRLHLLLADILARRQDYGSAIEEMKTYLIVAPSASDAESVRANLAKLEKLNSATPKAQPE